MYVYDKTEAIFKRQLKFGGNEHAGEILTSSWKSPTHEEMYPFKWVENSVRAHITVADSRFLFRALGYRTPWEEGGYTSDQSTFNKYI